MPEPLQCNGDGMLTDDSVTTSAVRVSVTSQVQQRVRLTSVTPASQTVNECTSLKSTCYVPHQRTLDPRRQTYTESPRYKI